MFKKEKKLYYYIFCWKTKNCGLKKIFNFNIERFYVDRVENFIFIKSLLFYKESCFCFLQVISYIKKKLCIVLLIKNLSFEK